MFDPKKFTQFVIAADKQGLLVHVHAIGDKAVTETLNGFEAARKINGNNKIPHTITIYKLYCHQILNALKN
jgi:Predicted metal-dependent hydrolase with the TIM-barrel fold